MIHETIKAILGEDLAKQVEEKLAGKGKDGKDVDLVVGNDGTHVPVEKYNLVKQEKATAEQLATSIKTELDALKASSDDVEKLKADLATAQQNAGTMQADHQKEIENLRKSHSVAMSIIGNAYDPSDVVGALDLEKIEIDESGNIKSGLDDQLKSIREKKPHWFKPEGSETPPATGGIPPAAGGSPAAAVNPWKKETFNLTEQGRILRDDPNRAAMLKSQAGVQ